MQLPQAFKDSINNQLGPESNAFFDSLAMPSPISIRANSRKWKNPEGTRVPWSEYGYYLASRPSFTLDPLFHAGCYYVQEASSMLLEQAVKQSIDLAKPIMALDLCAAPGGKSTHLLSLISNQSLLVSNEVIRARAAILSENITKWGYGNSVVTNNDPADFEQLAGFFDLIVVDAPCSGEGMFRKDAQAVSEWSDEHVRHCAQRQQRILADAWPALKENGILIYSTCTYNEIENEQNLHWLAQQNEVEFKRLQLAASWGVQEVENLNVIGYRCYPHRLTGEGFFLSVTQKKQAQPQKSFRLKDVLPLANKKTVESLAPWMMNSHHELLQLGEMVIRIPHPYHQEINILTQCLNTTLRGSAIATQKQKKFVPEHAWALSVDLNQANFVSIDLSLEEAIAFLKKEPIQVGEGLKGFALATYQQVPLGWMNLLGNRINNLYPSAWRILKK
ncbi:MAG: methyltransferase RsmF C-terminal domain-like protein [Cytophagales bacterium]